MNLDFLAAMTQMTCRRATEIDDGNACGCLARYPHVKWGQNKEKVFVTFLARALEQQFRILLNWFSMAFTCYQVRDLDEDSVSQELIIRANLARLEAWTSRATACASAPKTFQPRSKG